MQWLDCFLPPRYRTTARAPIRVKFPSPIPLPPHSPTSSFRLSSSPSPLQAYSWIAKPRGPMRFIGACLCIKATWSCESLCERGTGQWFLLNLASLSLNKPSPRHGSSLQAGHHTPPPINDGRHKRFHSSLSDAKKSHRFFPGP
jgi:hypothetical protein